MTYELGPSHRPNYLNAFLANHGLHPVEVETPLLNEDQTSEVPTRPLAQVEFLKNITLSTDVICIGGLENKDPASGMEWSPITSDVNLPLSEEAMSFLGKEHLTLLFVHREGRVFLGISNTTKRIVFDINRNFQIVDCRPQVFEGGNYYDFSLKLPENGLSDLQQVASVAETISRSLIDRSSTA